VIVIMTETSRATHELPKQEIADRVSAPALWVSASDLLGLFPALLLYAVRETPRVGVGGDSKVFEESGGVFGNELAFQERNRGRECGSTWARPR
jgi:hypothetical protein